MLDQKLHTWYQNNDEIKRPRVKVKSDTFDFGVPAGRCHKPKELFSKSEYGTAIQPIFNLIRASDSARESLLSRLASLNATRALELLPPVTHADVKKNPDLLSDIPEPDPTTLTQRGHFAVLTEATDQAWQALSEESRQKYETEAAEAKASKAETKKVEKDRKKAKDGVYTPSAEEYAKYVLSVLSHRSS